MTGPSDTLEHNLEAETATLGACLIRPTGPIGLVDRKKHTKPDNTNFWAAFRKAKTAIMEGPGRVDTLKLRVAILERVMVYCSLTADRVCYASVGTIARKESAGVTSTRRHIQALERDGFLEATGSRKGGRNTATTYRPGAWFLKHSDAPEKAPDCEPKPSGLRAVNPPDCGDKYLVPESTYKTTVPVHTGSSRRRYCTCGHSWLKKDGFTCYKCNTDSRAGYRCSNGCGFTWHVEDLPADKTEELRDLYCPNCEVTHSWKVSRP